MSPAEEDEQDLTRKQRREQARAQRKALEQAEASSAQRRKRLIQLGSVIGAVVVIVVVILVATSGGSSKPPVEKQKGKETPAVVTEVSSLIGGIPQSATTLGKPNAPVTMQYFGDLECPVCKDFTTGALKPLIERYVRPGKLRIEYRNLETATREPETFRTQQVAAMAAGKQNKAWYYIELFYHQQGEENSGYVTEKYLQELAQQTPGLALSSWTSARGDAAFTNAITSDAQAANNNGFRGTPSFLIGKTGQTGKKYEYTSLTDPSGFEAAISSALK